MIKAMLIGSAVFLTGSLAWAGGSVATAPAPTLDEAGLLMLAAGLVGAGLALVRRR